MYISIFWAPRSSGRKKLALIHFIASQVNFNVLFSQKSPFNNFRPKLLLVFFLMLPILMCILSDQFIQLPVDSWPVYSFTVCAVYMSISAVLWTDKMASTELSVDES